MKKIAMLLLVLLFVSGNAYAKKYKVNIKEIKVYAKIDNVPNGKTLKKDRTTSHDFQNHLATMLDMDVDDVLGGPYIGFCIGRVYPGYNMSHKYTYDSWEQGIVFKEDLVNGEWTKISNAALFSFKVQEGEEVSITLYGMVHDYSGNTTYGFEPVPLQISELSETEIFVNRKLNLSLIITFVNGQWTINVEYN